MAGVLKVTVPSGPGLLTGTPSASHPKINAVYGDVAVVFNGVTPADTSNPAEMFFANSGTNVWIQLDLGSSKLVTSARQWLLTGYANRTSNSSVWVSDVADFSSDATMIGSVGTVSAAAIGWLDYPITPHVAKRYVRMKFADATNGMSAEIEYYGN